MELNELSFVSRMARRTAMAMQEFAPPGMRVPLRSEGAFHSMVSKYLGEDIDLEKGSIANIPTDPLGAIEEARKAAGKLREAIQNETYRHYIVGDVVITDAEYDALLEDLRAIIVSLKDLSTFRNSGAKISRRSVGVPPLGEKDD